MSDDPYSLTKLADIVEPAPVSWWPLAPALWLIAILALAWLTLFGVWCWRRWRANRYRREALRSLDQVAARVHEPASRVGIAAAIADLLKQAALAGFPREHVASLTGRDWITFLERTCGGTPVPVDVARLITEIPYAATSPQAVDPYDLDRLIRFARQWITGHHQPREGPGRPPGSLDISDGIQNNPASGP